jgi:hypothetical protein
LDDRNSGGLVWGGSRLLSLLQNAQEDARADRLSSRQAGAAEA